MSVPKRSSPSLALQAILTFILFAFSFPALAQRPVLTIEGIGIPISFTLAEIQALPENEVQTETIWTDKSHRFSSVSFKDLMEHLDISYQGKSVTMVALNDYRIKVDIDTLIRHDAFIAYAIDGQKMRIRDKGPLWVLYPFSAQPEINIPPYQAHSIWQLKTLVIHP